MFHNDSADLQKVPRAYAFYVQFQFGNFSLDLRNIVHQTFHTCNTIELNDIEFNGFLLNTNVDIDFILA